MKIEHDATLMRIYLSESARSGGQDALTAIVNALEAAGISGATVFKGIEGFGSSGVVSSDRTADGWVDLPLLIEVVDTDDKVRGFVPTLEKILDGGLVTLERVQTVLFRGRD